MKESWVNTNNFPQLVPLPEQLGTVNVKTLRRGTRTNHSKWELSERMIRRGGLTPKTRKPQQSWAFRKGYTVLPISEAPEVHRDKREREEKVCEKEMVYQIYADLCVN